MLCYNQEAEYCGDGGQILSKGLMPYERLAFIRLLRGDAYKLSVGLQSDYVRRRYLFEFVGTFCFCDTIDFSLQIRQK